MEELLFDFLLDLLGESRTRDNELSLFESTCLSDHLIERGTLFRVDLLTFVYYHQLKVFEWNSVSFFEDLVIDLLGHSNQDGTKIINLGSPVADTHLQEFSVTGGDELLDILFDLFAEQTCICKNNHLWHVDTKFIFLFGDALLEAFIRILLLAVNIIENRDIQCRDRKAESLTLSTWSSYSDQFLPIIADGKGNW